MPAAARSPSCCPTLPPSCAPPRARGMRAPYGEGSAAFMREQLAEWLDWSLNRRGVGGEGRGGCCRRTGHAPLRPLNPPPPHTHQVSPLLPAAAVARVHGDPACGSAGRPPRHRAHRPAVRAQEGNAPPCLPACRPAGLPHSSHRARPCSAPPPLSSPAARCCPPCLTRRWRMWSCLQLRGARAACGGVLRVWGGVGGWGWGVGGGGGARRGPHLTPPTPSPLLLRACVQRRHD